jgi:hypothetical protein
VGIEPALFDGGAALLRGQRRPAGRPYRSEYIITIQMGRLTLRGGIIKRWRVRV